MMFVAICSVASSTLHAVTVSKWEEFNGHTYGILEEHQSWQEAEDAAIALGGHLVTINDASENAWVMEFGRGLRVENSSSRNGAIAWIGYNLSGGPHWSSGEPVTFNNYQSGSGSGPFVYIHVADYLAPPSPGVWGSNGIHNFSPNQPRGIIEINTIIPEPVTAMSSPPNYYQS
jgi:hypothetical protein